MTTTKTRRKPAVKQVKAPKIDLEFVAERTSLLTALTGVMRAVPSGGMIPALTGVSLELKANKLTLRGTDLELSISTIVTVDGPLAGKALVPGKMFTEVVRAAGPTVRVRVSEQVCTVEAHEYHADISSFSPDDFPTFMQVNGTNRKVDAAPLNQAMKRTLIAASTDTARPILNGVLFDTENGKLRMAATDSYRLSSMITKIDAFDRTVIVPVRALASFVKILPSDAPTVNVRLGDRAIAFEVGDSTVACRVIEGEFPNYRNLIPEQTLSNPPVHVTVDRGVLLDSVARLRPLLQGEKPLRMAFTPKTTTLTVRGDDEGNGEDKIKSELTGPRTFKIAFNADYLTAALQSFDGDQVEFIMSDERKPMFIRPVGDTDGLYLLMPTRVAD